MGSYHYDREKSALRACIAFMKSVGKPMTIDEIAAGVPFTKMTCYTGLVVAMGDGYVKNGPKRKRESGKGNLKITYLVTRKELPPFKPVTAETIKERQREAKRRAELNASKRAVVPFRHWMDAALFGPAQCVQPAEIEPRIYKQPMEVEESEEEMEA